MKSSCCHSKKIYKEEKFHICMNPQCGNYLSPTVTYSSRVWNKIFMFFLFIFLFLISFNDFSFDSSSIKSKELNRHVYKIEQVLSKQNLRNELDRHHIICPDQVYAQIMIESGNLNSFLTKKTNNLLGMRFPFKRKTTAIGIFLPSTNQIFLGTQSELKKYRKLNHYAVYNSWEDCVKDYKYWQEKSFKLTEQYLLFLGSYYAEDSLYVSKIKSITPEASGN